MRRRCIAWSVERGFVSSLFRRRHLQRLHFFQLRISSRPRRLRLLNRPIHIPKLDILRVTHSVR
jgi:hypothetical protein